MFHARSAVGFVCCLALCGCDPVPEPSASAPDRGVEGPSPASERFVRAVVDAANRNDRAALRRLFGDQMDPRALEGDGLAQLVEGRLFDLRRYGELEYRTSEREGDEWMQWLLASPTGVWLGMKVYESEEGFGGIAIRRGSAPRGASPELPEDLGRHLEAYLAELRNTDRFSGSVLVAEGDSILFAAGYGTLYPGGPDITVDTPLNIASVGKMFTAVSLLQLVEDGTVSLDDSLAEWIPEFPEAIGTAVTLRDLLLHTSGIELDEIDEFNRRMLDAGNPSEILAAQLAFADTLIGPDGGYTPPGEFDYSNEGINLLGIVIERAGGASYCDRLERHVFRPAGMDHTHCRFGDRFHIGYAYDASDPLGPRVENRDHLGRFPWPAGMHLSSARDLFRFHRALVRHELLGERLHSEATSVQIVEAETPSITYAYGYGFEVQDYLGLRSVGHAGGMEGVSARFAYYPAQDRLVVVLSNYDTAGVIVASYLRDLTAAAASPASSSRP